MDSIAVRQRPSFDIRGPLEICQEGSGQFAAFDTDTGQEIAANWWLINALGDTVWQTVNGGAFDLTVPFPAGDYRLYASPATPADFCRVIAQRNLRVLALPDNSFDVMGERQICVGQPYAYRVEGPAGLDYEWEITNGTEQLSRTGAAMLLGMGPGTALPAFGYCLESYWAGLPFFAPVHRNDLLYTGRDQWPCGDLSTDRD